MPFIILSMLVRLRIRHWIRCDHERALWASRSAARHYIKNQLIGIVRSIQRATPRIYSIIMASSQFIKITHFAKAYHANKTNNIQRMHECCQLCKHSISCEQTFFRIRYYEMKCAKLSSMFTLELKYSFEQTFILKYYSAEVNAYYAYTIFIF